MLMFQFVIDDGSNERVEPLLCVTVFTYSGATSDEVRETKLKANNSTLPVLKIEETFVFLSSVKFSIPEFG